jgi:hypothetical protein
LARTASCVVASLDVVRRSLLHGARSGGADDFREQGPDTSAAPGRGAIWEIPGKRRKGAAVVPELAPEQLTQFSKRRCRVEVGWRHPVSSGDLEATPEILDVALLVAYGANSGLERQSSPRVGEDNGC